MDYGSFTDIAEAEMDIKKSRVFNSEKVLTLFPRL